MPATRRHRGPPATARAMTLPETMISLALTGALLVSAAVAIEGAFAARRENHSIAQATHVARVVLRRMMRDARTATAIDTGGQRISIVPPLNPENVTNIEYELVSGTLYYRRTVDGTETSQSLIASGDDMQVETFTVTRETAVDGEGVTYTKSVTAVLGLSVGGNPLQVTASACPRRNMTY